MALHGDLVQVRCRCCERLCNPARQIRGYHSTWRRGVSMTPITPCMCSLTTHRGNQQISRFSIVLFFYSSIRMCRIWECQTRASHVHSGFLDWPLTHRFWATRRARSWRQQQSYSKKFSARWSEMWQHDACWVPIWALHNLYLNIHINKHEAYLSCATRNTSTKMLRVNTGQTHGLGCGYRRVFWVVIERGPRSLALETALTEWNECKQSSFSVKSIRRYWIITT